MDSFLAVLVVWLAGVVLLLFLVVCGGNASRGTALGRLHHGLSTLPCNAGTWLIQKLCGHRGLQAVADTEEYLCLKPNPALQLLYALMLGGGYYIYSQNIFPLLPGKFVADYHVHSGTLVVLVCFALLCVCSNSNPGEVTKANAGEFCRVYRYGEELTPQAPPKACRTCQLPSPARSKHCPICGICVARFDHHCGWINNCVGSHNLRYFLLFLGANTFLCFYANTVAFLAIWSEMDRRNVFTASKVDYRTGRIIRLGEDRVWLLRWTVFEFMHGIMVNFFLFVMGLMLTAFSAYHLWLVVKNSTTYEQIKTSRDLRLAKLTQLPAPEEDCAAGPRSPDPSYERAIKRGWIGRLLTGPNDRGLLANLEECLLPEHMHIRFGTGREKRD